MIRKQSIVSFIFAMILFIPVFAQERDQNHGIENQTILGQFMDQYGFVHQPLYVLSNKPGALPAFMTYGRSLMNGGPLTVRECNLVTLSAAVANHSPGCIRNQIRKLKRMGVSEEEILQTILIAGLLGNTTALQDAYSTLQSESITVGE
ncbi:carboxymuconolactone decarboxylase family protein [bacterium]|nr:carboxymuconolactone decarboxylase family protein [bacterium]